MRVADILNYKGGAVETIRPDAKVLMAVHRLRMQNVGALVVSRDGLRVEGVLSERDVVPADGGSSGPTVGEGHHRRGGIDVAGEDDRGPFPVGLPNREETDKPTVPDAAPRRLAR